MSCVWEPARKLAWVAARGYAAGSFAPSFAKATADGGAQDDNLFCKHALIEFQRTPCDIDPHIGFDRLVFAV
jgi:hypothetical protein